MRKRLIRKGRSVVLVLDRELLAAACLDAGATVDVSTRGDVIIVSPVRIARRTEKLKTVSARAHGRYARTFRQLAD